LNELIITLLNFRINYNLVDSRYFEQWHTNAGFICGFVFVVIFTPLLLYSYKVAARRFKKMHHDETVIHVIKNGLFFMLTTLYITGFFFGYFILPFICFENIPSIEHITDLTWIGYFAAFLFFMCILMVRFNIVYVLSNKRIELVSGCFLFNKIFLKINLDYKDIEEAESESWLCFEFLYIKLKNGEYFNGIHCFANLKQAAMIINKYASKGGF